VDDDEEELNKLIRKFEAMMKRSEDASRHFASSMKALPDTLAITVDDVIFDRVQSLGDDIGKAISKAVSAELGTRGEILESTVANITESFATIRKFVRALQILSAILAATLLASGILCLMTLQVYFSMDLTRSALIKVPLAWPAPVAKPAVLPAPAPLPPAQNPK
jgi:hypothetical protein